MRWKASSCGAGSQISTVCAPLGMSFTVTAYSKLKERSRGAGRFAAKPSAATDESAHRLIVWVAVHFSGADLQVCAGPPGPASVTLPQSVRLGNHHDEVRYDSKNNSASRGRGRLGAFSATARGRGAIGRRRRRHTQDLPGTLGQAPGSRAG